MTTSICEQQLALVTPGMIGQITLREAAERYADEKGWDLDDAILMFCSFPDDDRDDVAVQSVSFDDGSLVLSPYVAKRLLPLSKPFTK